MSAGADVDAVPTRSGRGVNRGSGDPSAFRHWRGCVRVTLDAWLRAVKSTKPFGFSSRVSDSCPRNCRHQPR